MVFTEADKDIETLSSDHTSVNSADYRDSTEITGSSGHVKQSDISLNTVTNVLGAESRPNDIILDIDDKDNAVAELVPMLKENDQDNDGVANVQTEDESTGSEPVPIDRGWAWMILLGATLEMIIIIGILKTSGIFFVNFQKRFNSSSSMTSLISTVQNGVYSVGALLVMTVGVKFLSGRKFNMIGGTVLCIAYIISSSVEDVRLLLFSHGVLQGLGIACMQPIAIVMVGSYFDKRRGFANSIANSGGSLGGLILAPLLTTLFENYGYSGAMLITSGIFLNGWVTGALFRSQTFYTKRQKQVHIAEDNVFIKDNNIQPDINNGSVTNATNGNPKLLTNGNIHRHLFLRGQTSLNVPDSPSSPLSLDSVEELRVNNGRKRAETFSEGDNYKNRHEALIHRRLKSQMDKPHSRSSISLLINKISESKVAKYASSEYVVGSLLDIPYIAKETKISVSISDSKSKENGSIFKTILEVFDFSLFKNPVFVGFIISAGFLCASNALVPVYLAPHVKENGISVSDIATLYTIFSAIDFCSRIIVGIISDKGWLRRSTIIGISACIIGITAHLVRFYTSYGWFLFYAVILGLFSGVHFSLFAVVIVDYLTLAKLQSCLGFTTLFHGAGVSCSFAVIGVLRDSSGYYLIPFHLLGTMAFVGGLLMASLPLIEKFFNKKKTTDEQS